MKSNSELASEILTLKNENEQLKKRVKELERTEDSGDEARICREFDRDFCFKSSFAMHKDDEILDHFSQSKLPTSIAIWGHGDGYMEILAGEGIVQARAYSNGDEFSHRIKFN